MDASVNGRTLSLDHVDPHQNALDWLRGCGLTDVKEGCAEGECGACAVLVAQADGAGSRWVALNSCLVPALALDGQQIVTAQGLGTADKLHPVQREMALRGGSQCGYCTPGFVCSMAAEYYRADRAGSDAAGGEAEHHHAHDDWDLIGANGFDLHALSGNLCRCTGYRPIKDAAFALGTPADDDPLARQRSDPAPAARAGSVTVGAVRFTRPADLDEAVRVLRGDPDATVVAGSTDWGVGANLTRSRTGHLVAIDALPQLREFVEDDEQFVIGAALTLSETERLLGGRIPLLDQLFPQFASPLIRNGATIGGNLGTCSPIGDTPPVLLALGADVVLAGADGERVVPLNRFFTGYRASVRAPGELIRAVRIPKPLAAYTAFHKIAKRPFDDISSVAVGYAIDIEDGTVTRASIGLGGVAATALRASEAERLLVGRPWSAQTVWEASTALATTGTPMDDHRASSRYRSEMLRTSLLKFFAEQAVER